MKKNFFKTRKILAGVAIFSIVFQSAVFLLPSKAWAQSASAGLNGNLHTGFDVGGIAATAIECSGVMDKISSALQNLLNIVPTEVPVGDATNNTKENCWDVIAHQVVVRIMDKITLATVDWINSGFEGSPLYLEDPEQFFQNVAAQEINGITGWFTASPEGYPFGQIVMTSILVGLQAQLQQSVQFSLNQVLAHGTYEEYKFDFNVGGWAGYTALLNENNNPFGNYLLVNKELGRRIGGTSMNIAKNFSNQLTQSGGFLNQRKCVVSGTGADDYIPANDPRHLDPGTFHLIPTGGTMTGQIYLSLPTVIQQELDSLNGSDAQAEVYNDFVLRSTCKQWKTITPGSVVSNQLTTALNLHNNKLIQADEVSEDLGLIFDALLNQLVSSGLDSLQSSSNGGNSSNNVLIAQAQGLQPGQVQNGNAAPPAVDAITGTGLVDTALVTVQNNYITNANQAIPLFNELIQKIRALDYCVPGPNPNWQTLGQQNFQNAVNSVPAFASNDSNPNSAEQQNEDYYANAISTLTGIEVAHSSSMHNHDQFVVFMQNVFAKYSARMTDNLSGYPVTAAPPAVRIFLQSLLSNLALYESSLDDLNNYVANIQSYLPTLGSIQSALNQIQQLTGNLDPNNPQVQAQVSLFNSISSHFATESQLQSLVNTIPYLTSQITSVNGYLGSCVNETINQPYNHPRNRTTYPSPYFPFPGLPTPDDTFLPGVDFGNGPNDINVDFQGVTATGSSDGLTTFETTLGSVY